MYKRFIGASIFGALFITGGYLVTTSHPSSDRQPAASREIWDSEDLPRSQNEMNQQTCNRIESYEAAESLTDKELNFLPNICTPAFRHGKILPEMTDLPYPIVGKRPLGQSKQIARQVNEMTKTQFLKKSSLIPLNQIQREVVMKAAHLAIDQNAALCCGADFKCNSYFRSTKPYFCDPNGYDWQDCLSSVAYVSSKNFGKEIKKGLSGDAEALQRLDSGYDYILDAANGLYENGQTIGAPEITMSLNPYTNKEVERERMPSMNHETAHICSLSRMAAAVSHGGATPREQIAKTFADVALGECEIDRAAKETYRKVIAPAYNDPKLFSCVLELVTNANNPNHENYISGGCPLSQLEEGLAEIFSQKIAAKRGETTIKSLCFSSNDQDHPKASLLAKCYMLHSTEIRETLKKSLSCSTEKKRQTVRSARPRTSAE